MDLLDPGRIRAIDVADECVRWRRRRCVEDPGAEILVMFISRRPDPPHLAKRFQLEPIERWGLWQRSRGGWAATRETRRGGLVLEPSVR